MLGAVRFANCRLEKSTMRFRVCLFASVISSALTAPLYAAQNTSITINGYASFEIEKQIEKAGEGAGDPNLSFDADLIDLVLNFQVADKIRVATDVTWEHGPATEDDRGNVAVEYAFTEYAFSDVLKVRFGKMFTPFGIFNEIHTAKPAFLSMKEASSTNKTARIVEAGYRFFPRWAVGIAVQGDGVLAGGSFDYILLIANGEQSNTNPFEEDDNNSKSITARFRIDLSERFSVGNSFYFDNISESGFNRLISEGIQLEYVWRRVRVLGEAVIGFKRPDSGGGLKQVGWFIQPSYHLPNGITPYVRFEHLDPNLDALDDWGVDLIVGINFEIAKGFMVKMENNYFRGGAESSLDAFPGKDYNEIKASVVVGF